MSSSRIRVLLVSHSLSTGGAERFASTLLGALDRDRFEPSLCLAVDRRTYPLPADVPVRALGYRGQWDLPRTLFALRRFLRESRPDVVLSNVVSTNCLVGGALVGLRRRPAWVARVGMAPRVGEPFVQRHWARAVYPQARAIVVNAERMRESFTSSNPGTAGRVRWIPNPTDFARIDRLAEEEAPREAGAAPTILFLGRLTTQKRPDVLLEAFALVRREMDARLLMCGDGPLRGEVEGRNAALGLGETVELLGFCENPFPLMRRADLFVLTSDFEGLPNALIEAQGLGLPAVATRCPFGPDEIVEEGTTGILVPMGDAGAVARAILEILGDREKRRQMSEAARESARRRYGLSKILPQWEEVLFIASQRVFFEI